MRRVQRSLSTPCLSAQEFFQKSHLNPCSPGSCLQSTQSPSPNENSRSASVPSPPLLASRIGSLAGALRLDFLTLCWPCLVLPCLATSVQLPCHDAKLATGLRSFIPLSVQTMLSSNCNKSHSKSKHGTRAPPAARNMRKPVEIAQTRIRPTPCATLTACLSRSLWPSGQLEADPHWTPKTPRSVQSTNTLGAHMTRISCGLIEGAQLISLPV